MIDRDPRTHRTGDQDGRRCRLQGHSSSRHSADSGRPGGGLHRRAAGGSRQQRFQQRQWQQRPGGVAERAPRSVDRLPRAAVTEAEGVGDLLVAEAFQLTHHNRRPLCLWQRLQPPHQVGQLFAALQLLRRAGAAGDHLGQGLGRGRAVAQVVERGVADDAEEPGAQLDLGPVAAQRQQGLGEGVLGHVLGPAADDRRRVAGQRLAVAADDLLEGVLVALADEGDEGAVRLRAQGGADVEASGESLGWWRHLWFDGPFGLLI